MEGDIETRVYNDSINGQVKNIPEVCVRRDGTSTFTTQIILWKIVYNSLVFSFLFLFMYILITRAIILLNKGTQNLIYQLQLLLDLEMFDKTFYYQYEHDKFTVNIFEFTFN